MVNDRIKILRTLKGYTQKEMAELLHKSQSTYSRLESGELAITTEEIKDIATVLDCQVEDLLKEQSIKDILQHNGKVAAGNYSECISELKEISEQYKELLRIVLEHQQNTLKEIKAFVSESQTQISQMLKELILTMKT